jgi:hypothetical protein
MYLILRKQKPCTTDLRVFTSRTATVHTTTAMRRQAENPRKEHNGTRDTVIHSASNEYVNHTVEEVECTVPVRFSKR